MRALRIGTRGSDLARTQAGSVATLLEAAGIETALAIIRTAGDRSAATSFSAIGAPGVFVREIEQALIDGRIDLAVHSFKDLPAHSPAVLTVAAVPARVDAADVLITRRHAVDDPAGDVPLGPGAVVGTSSVRRQVWLRHLRDDLRTEPLRGNVPTRLRRLREGRYDAIVLAAAGLERLQASLLGRKTRAELAGLTVRRLDPAVFVPAPTQGALAIQCRSDDVPLREALARLDDPPSRVTVDAERLLLRRVEGGCDVAFGAYCEAGADGYAMVAMLERGGRVLHERLGGPEPGRLAEQLWDTLQQRIGAA